MKKVYSVFPIGTVSAWNLILQRYPATVACSSFCKASHNLQLACTNLAELVEDTLPKTKIAPESQWLEDKISFGEGLLVVAMLV